MVTAASRIREIREGGRIGVFADNARLDWDILAKRLWEKIDESKSIQGYYDKFPNVDTYNGTAAFVNNHTLDVTLNDGTDAKSRATRFSSPPAAGLTSPASRVSKTSAI